MEGSIQPLPPDRIVPQPPPRESTSQRERGQPQKRPTPPEDEEAQPEPAAEDAPPKAAPGEEGLGRRLDVTA